LIYLRERIPDIIYLDISMPGVDGFEIMAFLRREPRLLHIPVVIVTSDDQPETTRLALSQGALDVIIKPATIEALERTLKSAKLTP
jgi:CheY-like chemotaxis protein